MSWQKTPILIARRRNLISYYSAIGQPRSSNLLITGWALRTHNNMRIHVRPKLNVSIYLSIYLYSSYIRLLYVYAYISCLYMYDMSLFYIVVYEMIIFFLSTFDSFHSIWNGVKLWHSHITRVRFNNNWYVSYTNNIPFITDTRGGNVAHHFLTLDLLTSQVYNIVGSFKYMYGLWSNDSVY